ncbi:MAG: hypothetical protein ABS79_07825 [Planctomycetes bacterium SCN 63-9]|nr:MAG: hypothetical protein ABS79_07825 [Planctomycetes bacterium SCN 63-9]
MASVAYAHITIDERGEPIISGTRTRVRMLVLDRLAHGWDVDEIHRNHPHLTLGQIHSALAYYYDHQVEIDRDIERRLNRVDALRAAQEESPGRRKLRERGLLP